MKVAEFERLFRQAAGLDVDKNDLKRVSDFLRDKLYDLLVVAERNAKYNGRDLIFEPDLPITRGLQETLQEFRRMDTALELKPVLDALAALPPLDLEVAEDVRNLLPELAGALVVAYARVLKELDPSLKNPQTEHHERAERVFNLLL
ncbi:hypothetical protein TthAA229_15320 [Thermus thermophilus]|uniref:DUF1931 family protein n=2 Tax=Thermus thermophilus TaxID=274 RepID=A0AAD1NXK3_THETH|nr:DUF1931 family protein [Thermus thermophilus]BBL82752.1 hypothetical protein TthAA220_15360 [Thermus thermophilus]BBL85051.1 hypothetical protein TthAA229_15320 [Thermus thermophilus]BCZ87413.1 hypothetical protein TthAA11_15950 [Thermus thermophilus]